MDPRAIAHISLLARLELSEEEKARYTEQLSRIMASVERVCELDLAGVEPLVCVVPEQNVLRDDVPRPSLPRAEVLAAAPAHSAEGFLVPQVLEGGES